jgi:uncharacterized membrane protein
MRKLLVVIIGLMLFAGAIGALTYRVFVEPQRVAKTLQQLPPPIVTPVPREMKIVPPPVMKSAPRPEITARFDGWHLFEVVLNVLNVVVGVLGIWMTIVGIRMQYAAPPHQGPMRLSRA